MFYIVSLFRIPARNGLVFSLCSFEMIHIEIAKHEQVRWTMNMRTRNIVKREIWNEIEFTEIVVNRI